MEKTLTGKTPDKLDEKLALYKELTDQRVSLESRLNKVENEKGSVNERIYNKVKAGYDRQLEEINERLAPIQGEIEAFRRDAAWELDQLREQIVALDDELSEGGFRHRVGEFDDAAFEEVKNRVTPDLIEKKSRFEELTRHLRILETGKSSATQPEPDALQSKEPTQTVEEKAAPAGRSFENPQAWFDEIGSNRRGQIKDTKAKEPPAKEEEDDPLSALADPSTEKRQEPAPDDKQEEPVVRFPNLVINNGVNAGKKIPLLPMTMSIGREHDNNIELKDPEVARYHARILYERGEFILEDLDSSTGTWLNGESTKQGTLKEGDKVRIGSTELTIEFG